MIQYAIALVICVVSTQGALPYAEEKYLKNIQQLTWGGENVDPVFGLGGKHWIYQGAGKPWYGTCCDQIYRMSWDEPANTQTAQRISSGIGLATRPRHVPGSFDIIYSSTSISAVYAGSSLHSCPRKLCATNRTQTDNELQAICAAGKTWDLFPEYDIYRVNKFGNAIDQLTTEDGFDGDADISPDGKQIVFTSMRTGDPEIFIMDADGFKEKQLTFAVGYDGGATFSRDGKKIVFRASRPKDDKEVAQFTKLLSYNLVSPLHMELFMMNTDGTNITQITDLGGCNLTPHFMKGDNRIIFGSNFESEGQCGDFSIYITDLDGKNIERVSSNQGGFDGFPMFDVDQKRLLWSSSRNGTIHGELNIFVADWIADSPQSNQRITDRVAL